MAIELKQVPYIERYFHKFRRKDGAVFEIETTEEDYKQLATVKHIDPTNPDGKWLNSYSGCRINTGEWTDEKGIQKLVNIDGNMIPTKNDLVVGNMLTSLGDTEVIKYLIEIARWH